MTPGHDGAPGGPSPSPAIEQNGRPGLHIVGIGASAGGLSALRQLFDEVPEDSGLAFVVVVHLAPEHRSHLSELLQPHVRMPVIQVTETVPIEPNRVYVIPPASNLDAVDTHLRLSALEERRQERAPIDHFFRTLAQTHDGTSVGVILTGTGSDGTLGLREIKDAGGLTIVQDPNEAQFDGMPQSAIAGVRVDLVLPLAEIPGAILQFASARPKLELPGDDGDVAASDGRYLQSLFALIRARTGRDFTHYKRSTILRRIYRRMQIAKVDELSSYVSSLREQPNELLALADDLLITVTSFFRDRDVWKRLEADVIPKLFAGRRPDEEIRAWSVGCATGEEAYSLAILLQEAVARNDTPHRFQVFASDLHEHSLAKAREGIYPGDIESDVSPERLSRFFIKENGGYRIKKEVREKVIFAPHNLFTDPPFSRLDLISCRNVLIYIQRQSQNDIMEVFHYALRPDGYLLLGTSETVEGEDLFRAVDKRGGFYRRRNVPAREPRLPVFPFTRSRLGADQEATRKQETEPVPYRVIHEQLTELFSPASILVSPDDRVLHLSTRAGRYLVHPAGVLTASVFKLVRDELQIELRSLLHDAREHRAVRRSAPIPVRLNGHSTPVVIHVHPVVDIPRSDREGFALILLEERYSDIPSPPTDTSRGSGRRQKAESALRAELDLTRQRLQASIAQFEAAQEEMRSSNEEMQSTNEELRSTLEELETSKEELQSMNEELQTLNQENRHKVEELGQLSGDLQNLLAASEIATLFVDRELRIMRFTPKLGELFNVRVTDRSRPITDLTNRLGYPQLADDATRVLKRLVPVEREVMDQSGNWYLTRVMPYRSAQDRIDGVAITFVEITARKRAEADVRAARDEAEHVIAALSEPVLVLTAKLEVRSANPAFFRHFGLEASQVLGRGIFEIRGGGLDLPGLRALLEAPAGPNVSRVEELRVEHDFGDAGHRVVLVNVQRLEKQQLIVVALHDITARDEANRTVVRSEERLQRMFNIEGIGVQVFDASGVLVEANEAFLDLLGASRSELRERQLTWQSLTPADFIATVEDQLRLMEHSGRIGPYERQVRRRDGTTLWILSVGASLGDGNVVEYCIDISQMKRVEAQLALELAALTRLHDLVARLLVSPDLAAALGEVLDAAIDIVGDEMGTVKIIDHDTGAFRIIAQRGFDAAAIRRFNQIAEDENSLARRSVRARERIVVEDVTTDPTCEPWREAAAEAGYRSVQSTPLVSRGGEVLGVLSTYYATPHLPSDRDLRILDLYARQAADFIEHVRNQEAARLENQRKDEFLAMLAHELRNPLAVIGNGIHMLRLARENDEAFAQVDAILQRQARQLSMLVDDLLDVSRISRGKLELRKEIVSLSEVVQAAVDASMPFIERAGHTLAVELPAGILHLEADPQRLAQAIANLIHNAAKFTPPSGRITLAATVGQGGVDISVTDTGIGLTHGAQDRIFEMFTQGDGQPRSNEAGLGIGLSLVRSLVELHGGTVTAQSAGPGQGSTFTIRLPEATQPIVSRRSTGSAESMLVPGRRRVLIVDDNEDGAEMLRQLLHALGHQVRIANDGAQAIEVAEAYRPDVILMDLGMPRVSGFEAARRIREQPWSESVAIVAVTGWGQEEDRRRSRESGFDFHLVKPVDLSALEAVFREVGARRK